MEQPGIRVTFKPNGQVEFAPHGYPGQKCRDITKSLEGGLGVTVNDVETSELYQSEHADANEDQTEGDREVQS